MLKCPKCEAGFTKFTIEGWTAYVVGIVRVDDQHRIENISPLTVKEMIAVKVPLKEQKLDIMCPKCGYKGKYDTYGRSFRCALFPANEADNTLAVTFANLYVLTPAPITGKFPVEMHLSEEGLSVLRAVEEFDLRQYLI